MSARPMHYGKQGYGHEACCERTALPEWGVYLCEQCRKVSCFLHAALWTDGERRCYFCFARTECLREAQGTLIVGTQLPNNDSRRQKWILLVDGLYVAGAQRHCLHLLEALNNSGTSGTVVALEGGGRWADLFVNSATAVVLSARSSLKWADLRKAGVDDGVHLVSAHLKYAVDWATRHVPISIPCFGHLHSEPSEHEHISAQWLSDVLGRCKRIFVPSISTKRHFEDVVLENAARPIESNHIRVLPNPIPNHSPNEDPIRLMPNYPKRSRIRLAVLSRLDHDKLSIPLLVETVVRLQVNGVLEKVRIAGDGECRQELEMAFQRANMGNWVEFLGFIDDIYSLYAWADVVFLPSKREAMPYVLLECVAAGRVLVAPSLGAIQDIRALGALFQYAPGDADGACHAIEEAWATSKGSPVIWEVDNERPLLNFRSWSRLVAKEYRLPWTSE